MLLELIIVVAVIGILAAVAVPDLTGMTDKAKIAKIQSDLSSMSAAVEMYYVEHGTYPSALSVLEGNGDSGYIKHIPEAPKGSSYVLNSITGEITAAFKGKTYSSYGTNEDTSKA